MAFLTLPDATTPIMVAIQHTKRHARKHERAKMQIWQMMIMFMVYPSAIA